MPRKVAIPKRGIKAWYASGPAYQVWETSVEYLSTRMVKVRGEKRRFAVKKDDGYFQFKSQALEFLVEYCKRAINHEVKKLEKAMERYNG